MDYSAPGMTDLFSFAANHIHLLLLWLYNPSADALTAQMSGWFANAVLCVYTSFHSVTVLICADYWLCVVTTTVFAWSALF